MYCQWFAINIYAISIKSMNNKIHHFAAEGTVFDPDQRLGYYTVGNDIFYNKNLALLRGSKVPTPDDIHDPVHWFFNEKTFFKYPWHIEPKEDLRELYRRRAQQIRDDYDYVRLELSGGADSSTVAFAFLLNGIHLDEVVYRYPKGGDKGCTDDPINTRAENYLSESAFAAKPILRWIANNYPATKITVHDYLSDMLEQQTDESWIFKTHHYLQPSHQVKHNVTASIEQRRMLDKGKRIAMVMGVDKPKLCIKDGKWFMYFVDSLAQRNNVTADDVDSVKTELFYWAPEGCNIMAKQAHLIKQWFEMPQNSGFKYLACWPNSNYALRTHLEQLIKPIIYPDYDFNTFQVAKSSNIFRAEMDTWFLKNMQDTSIFQVWEAGVKHVIENVHPRYLENTDQGLKQYVSPLYYVGDEKQTAPGIDTGASNTITEARNETYPIVHCINKKLVIY
jgi:hypothetical protein